MLKNTLIRTASAAVALVILVFVLLADVPMFRIIVTLLSLAMVGEVVYAFGGGIWGIFTGVISAEILYISMLEKSFEALMGAVFLCMALFAVFTLINHKRLDFKHMAAMCFATLYITFSMNHVILLREINGAGLNYLFVAFISAWVSDTGAYFAGCLLGKHKLIPDISPKKTVEGAIGGVLSAALGGVVLGFILKFGFKLSSNILMLAIVCGLGSVFGQMGDLIASMMKRKFGIKDFGKIMPGHGGLADRFDSILLVAPYVYYAIVLLSEFGIMLI